MRATDYARETGVVPDQGTRPGLATHGLLFHDQGVESLRGGIDRCARPEGAGADDHDVEGRFRAQRSGQPERVGDLDISRSDQDRGPASRGCSWRTSVSSDLPSATARKTGTELAKSPHVTAIPRFAAGDDRPCPDEPLFSAVGECRFHRGDARSARRVTSMCDDHPCRTTAPRPSCPSATSHRGTQGLPSRRTWRDRAQHDRLRVRP